MFGGASQAIKIFLIAILAAVLVAILIYYKVKLPTFKLELVTDRLDDFKTSANKAVSKSKTSSKSAADTYEEDELLPAPSTVAPKKDDAGVLKSLIKDKLKKSVQKKEDDAAVKQLYINFPKDKPTFDLTLLTADPTLDTSIDESWLVEKAQAIKDKLLEFDIAVDIEGFNIGPTVLQIKIQPQSGIKVSRIENLKKDISLAVKSRNLRVLAPIPGTDSVGIEIPNPKPQIVRLREMLADS